MVSTHEERVAVEDLQDLYRIILRFPGSTVEDFERSWQDRTVSPELAWAGAKVTWRRRLAQQRRSLVEHPAEQVRAWARRRKQPAG